MAFLSLKKARVAFRQRALLLAKRTRSRAALGPAPSLYACALTLKTGEVLPPASGHRKCGCEFRANGATRHQVFARVGVWGRRWWSGHRAFGCGAVTAEGDVLLGAVGGEKQRDETVGRGLEISHLSARIKLELRQRFADFNARGIVDVEQTGGDFSSIG